MSRLNLPNVTLVAISNVEFALTRLAVNRCCSQVAFGHAICIFDLDTSYSETLWYTVPKVLKTSHALIVQYDSWILDASLWNPLWLQYDYIGAPWPWHPSNRVGNGGFSLRSRRLMKFLMIEKARFPVRHPEDDTLCRLYRRALEIRGFIWAPDAAARDFSFEREPAHSTFGFHGIFNWPHVLSPDELKQQKSLATGYARSKPEWRELA